jgi:hypothetical protein
MNMSSMTVTTHSKGVVQQSQGKSYAATATGGKSARIEPLGVRRRLYSRIYRVEIDQHGAKVIMAASAFLIGSLFCILCLVVVRRLG